jgi:hypothetical protein
MSRFSLCVIGFGLGVATLLGSCEWIADIPERTQLTDPCDRYCQLSMQLCTGDNAIFHQATDCTNICATYNSDELKCRETELEQIEKSKAVEAPAYCANASLSGGQKKCGGSPCQNYCKAMGQVCGADHPEPGVTYADADGANSDACVKQCSVIPDRAKGSTSSESTFDLTKDHEGDTIQCRLVHLTLASTDKSLADVHCVHAYINPQPVDQIVPFCSTLEKTNEPRCQDYCAVVMASCVDTADEKHKVYETNSECMGACEAMEPGDLSIYNTSNTVACRKYHAYNAVVLSSPTVHCPHAGPGGAGVCGDDCDSLCTLVEQGCPDQWQSQYMSKAKTCHDECDKARKGDPQYNGGTSYSVAAAKRGDAFSCRLYHAAQAESQGSDNKDACDIAAGIRSCPFPTNK